MQARWMRGMLGTRATIPRIVVTFELGVEDRLSSIAWVRATMLRVRSQVDPRYDHERRLFSVAEEEPSSWSAILCRKCRAVGISLPEQTWDDYSASQRAYHLRQFAQTCVLPAFRKHEAVSWWDQTKQQQHWQRWDLHSWTLADIVGHGTSISDAQAWVQLKLQGFFTDDDNDGVSPKHAHSVGMSFLRMWTICSVIVMLADNFFRGG